MTKSKRPVRFEVVEGSNIDAMRENFKKTELYKQGDALLVWANEGDLFDPAHRTDGDDGELVERLIYTHEHGIFDAQIAGMLASPKEAADRITALSAEVERLRTERDRAYAVFGLAAAPALGAKP
jgi:uncharacterized small protein (DUF1192 family)